MAADNAPEAAQAPPAINLPGDPSTDTDAAQALHGAGLTGMAYHEALVARIGESLGGFDIGPSAMLHARDVLKRMAPRDPAEVMLVSQMLMTHARVLHLSGLANQQTEIANVRTAHEYADKASNTYRRLMLALAEYRRPPRAGASYTAINQANIAAQQIVNNGAATDGNATNEQGCGRAPALPADAGGAGVTSGVDPAGHPLGALHRPADG